MPGISAIETRDLVKFYKGAEEPALNGVSLVVPEGRYLACWAPMVLAKPQPLTFLCGILAATSGHVQLAGFDLNKNLKEIRQLIGTAPQDTALYPTLTARENLNFFGSMYGLYGKVLRERVNHSLFVFGLEKFANRSIRTYSGGMKRRINLIAGILHKPRILFLDEPTVGIDVAIENRDSWITLKNSTAKGLPSFIRPTTWKKPNSYAR